MSEILCPHGREFHCYECSEEYASDLAAPYSDYQSSVAELEQLIASMTEAFEASSESLRAKHGELQAEVERLKAEVDEFNRNKPFIEANMRDSLKSQLAAMQWQRITPENLPTNQDETYSAEHGCVTGAAFSNKSFEWWTVEREWTHFRPINPPTGEPHD